MSCWQRGPETFTVGNALLWNAFLLAACQSQVWQSLWYSEKKIPLYSICLLDFEDEKPGNTEVVWKAWEQQAGWNSFLCLYWLFSIRQANDNSFPFSSAVVVYLLPTFPFEWWLLKRWMDHNSFVGNCLRNSCFALMSAKIKTLMGGYIINVWNNKLWVWEYLNVQQTDVSE